MECYFRGHLHVCGKWPEIYIVCPECGAHDSAIDTSEDAKQELLEDIELEVMFK
jgi:hypothetical protein